MKHIISFQQLFENVQHNAIVLIKGKPKKGKKKLYAAHVIGSMEVRPGAEAKERFFTEFRGSELNGPDIRDGKNGAQREDLRQDSLKSLIGC